MVGDLIVSLTMSSADELWSRKLSIDVGLLGQDYMIGVDKVAQVEVDAALSFIH